ncbi:alpha/beta hydrolase [Cryomorphaceae bacterium 1068]|nr:alpha/beta hydrolase [Cryomorphaceae bacterium 1068]
MLPKKVIALLTLVFVSGLMSGCSSDWKIAEGSVPASESFDKYIDGSPISVESNHKYYSNIPYGNEERNVLDLWVSESDEQRPLIVYIHGGGFQGGDKSSAWNQPSKYGIGPEQINDFLEQGFSFASINYRLLQKTDKEGVLKCLNDSKRAIQFLRYHSSELNINAESIGLVGTSAGAGTALWIGFHDEMAEAGSDDPVTQQSSRVQAIAAQETQSTYDILRWSEDVFPNGIFTMDKIRGTALGNRLMVFYGVDDFNQLESDQIVKYRKEVDMLSMVDSGDPPVYILNKKDFKPDNGNRVGNLLHSPYHAVALRKVLTEAGVSRQIFIPAEGNKPNQSAADFLIEQLSAK